MAFLNKEELDFLIELREELESNGMDSPTIKVFNYIVDRHIQADKRVECSRENRREKDIEWRKQKRKMKINM